MRKLSVRFVAIVLTAILSIGSLIGANPKTPDFAYPQSVNNLATHDFSVALTQHKPVEVLRSLIALTIARNSISTDSLSGILPLYCQARSELHAPYAGMAALLEAAMLSERSSFASPTGEVRADILDAVSQALSQADAAKGVSLLSLDAIIDDASKATKNGLDLYDFIIYQSITLTTPYFLENHGVPVDMSLSADKRWQSMDPKHLADLLVDYHRGSGSIAEGMAVVCRANMMNDTVRREYLTDNLKRVTASAPASLPILQAMYDAVGVYDDSNFMKSADLLPYMEQAVKSNPKADGVDALRLDIAEIRRKVIEISLPNIVTPEQNIRVEFKSRNVASACLLLYRVEYDSRKTYRTIADILTQGKLVGTVPVAATPVSAGNATAADGKQPFIVRESVSLDVLPAGCYALVPAASATAKGVDADIRGISIPTVNVSAVNAVAQVGTMGKNGLYVVDSRNFRPISGAVCMFYPSERGNKTANKAGVKYTTDKSGFVAYPATDGRYEIIYRGSKFGGQYYNSTARAQSAQLLGRIFTDLSIYHPGDEVQMAGVVYRQYHNSVKVVSDVKVSVCLRDTKYKVLSRQECTTDSMGRVFAKFTLPNDSQLGTFSISMDKVNGKKSSDNDFLARAGVEVADYKSPTFYVTSEKGLLSKEGSEYLTLKGAVATYAGVPVAGAKVTYKVMWHPYRFWSARQRGMGMPMPYMESRVVCSDTIVADSSGLYSAECLLSSAANGADTGTDANTAANTAVNTRFAPAVGGYYEFTVSAVAPWGETATAPNLQVSMGENYYISPDISERVEVASDSVELKVNVYDGMGLPQAKELTYTLVKVDDGAKSVVAQGNFLSPLLRLNTKNVASGRYTLQISMVADTAVSATSDVVLWRMTDKRPAVKTPLWLTATRIVSPAGAKSVETVVGSSVKDGAILLSVSDMDGKVIDNRWLYPNGQNKKISLPAPKVGEVYFADFISGENFSNTQGSITIVSAPDTTKLNIKVSTMRNHVIPGSKEQVRVSVQIDNGEDGVSAAYPAAVMAVVTDKALDAISPFNWQFSPRSNIYLHSSLYQRAGSVDTQQYTLPLGRLPKSGFGGYGYGRWQLFGRSLNGDIAYARFESNLLASADGVMVRGSNYLASSKAEAAGEFMMADAANADGGGVPADKSSAQDMRLATTPLALFRPDLNVDSDGNVNVDFSWPESNTTWRLQMIAYDAELRTARYEREFVAQRPLMVRGSLLSFLHTSDSIVLTAVMANASDGPLAAWGEIEVVNPATGEVLLNYRSETASMASLQQTVVATEFTVSQNLSAILVRVKAESDTWSDAEQMLIPVLPAFTPVREAKVFYLDGNDLSYSMVLPNYSPDAKLTLRYSGNAVWYAIDALPKVQTPTGNSATELADALYANTVVAAINAKIASAPEAGSDASKYMKVAESAREANRTIVSTLWKLQNADGGLSWCPDMSSSQYITRSVLDRIAMICRGGFDIEFSDDFVKSAVQAVAYVDAEMLKQLNAGKKKTAKSSDNFNAVDWLKWFWVRDAVSGRWSVSANAELKSVRDRMLKAIAKDWRNYSLEDKALAARMLNMQGDASYRKQATDIIASISEFAVGKKGKGRWFETPGVSRRSRVGGSIAPLVLTARIMEAVDAVNPKSALTTDLRQWILLQREVTDWGSSAATVQVVNALLTVGNGWQSVTQLATDHIDVSIDGKPLALPKSDSRAGEVVMSLDARSVSGKRLSLQRTGTSPAWGGVVAEFEQPIVEVAASSVDDLSVGKSVAVVSGTGSVADRKHGVVINRGDMVRVNIRLRAGRDMDYIQIRDNRAAGFMPAMQLSGYESNGGLWLYREVKTDCTNLYIEHLPKGEYTLSYEYYAEQAGEFANGIATVESLLSPLQVAHSAGGIIDISLQK